VCYQSDLHLHWAAYPGVTCHIFPARRTGDLSSTPRSGWITIPFTGIIFTFRLGVTTLCYKNWGLERWASLCFYLDTQPYGRAWDHGVLLQLAMSGWQHSYRFNRYYDGSGYGRAGRLCLITLYIFRGFESSRLRDLQKGPVNVVDRK
jgi:hypothetical protein